ncbi:MAG: 3'(2'),5'-bisphosphate nucleotidase CysQ [Planctomycetota bacterium]
MSASREDLQRVRVALQQACELVQKHAAGERPFELKDKGGPVTAADTEVDALLRGILPSPGDGWLSEESEDTPARLGCRRVWIVDPLDGTRAFVARRPEYSVSIALIEDGVPVLGAIGNPAMQVSVIGGAGLGVFVSGEPQLPWPVDDGGLRVLASRSEWKRGEWRGMEAKGCHVLPVGSVAYKLALVAGGFADATWTLQPKHEWDVAAGVALVVAAGGEVWLPRGGHLVWNRARPRFRSFAAARAGQRSRVDVLLRGTT